MSNKLTLPKIRERTFFNSKHGSQHGANNFSSLDQIFLFHWCWLRPNVMILVGTLFGLGTHSFHYQYLLENSWSKFSRDCDWACICGYIYIYVYVLGKLLIAVITSSKLLIQRKTPNKGQTINTPPLPNRFLLFLIIVMCIPIVNTFYFFHLKHNCNFKGNWICLTMDQWSVQKPLHNIACTHIFTKQNNYSPKSAAFLELRLNPVNLKRSLRLLTI